MPIKKLPKAWQPPKLPSKIGDCIDAALKARAARKALSAEIKLLEDEEKRLKDHIINTFDKQDIEGAKGKLGGASLTHKDVPKIVSKEAFGKWVAANQAWDCLYGMAVQEACNLRWDEQIVIDGVEKFHVTNVTLTEK